MNTAVRIKDREFAVMDIETTGLFPGGHDRIVEVAIVRMSGDGNVLEQYATLVNPERDMGSVGVHGIGAADVLSAPRFAEIAGNVVDRISGAVVAGHNVEFDLRFVSGELGRLGAQIPPLPAVCTLALSGRAHLQTSSGRLASCCQALGIPHRGVHSALGDAQATAQLLLALVHLAGCDTLEDLECFGAPLPHGSFPHLARTGATCTRQAAAQAREHTQSYLARLVSKVPTSVRTLSSTAADSPSTLRYLEVLDRALEDRLVTPQEAEHLVQLAIELGMPRERITEVHHEYLRGLAIAAVADGFVSQAERGDLEEVAAWLGLGPAEVEAALGDAEALRAGTPLSRRLVNAVREGGEGRFPTNEAWVPTSDNLVGKSVCFTGEARCTLGGEPISRELAEVLARRAGLKVSSSVSRKLDMLVAADPMSQSGKAAKARAHGTRIVAESVFWRMIGVQVD